MLPQNDLPLRLGGRTAYLDFLGPQDEPWLRVLIGEMARFEGRRRRELCERLADPLPCEAPFFKRRAATRVLLHLWPTDRVSAVVPGVARAEVFAAAAAQDAPREQIVASVAGRLGTTPEALRASLFADLPGERIVRTPQPMLTSGEIVLRTNLAIAQTALARASAIDLRVEGGVRPIVRLAKLRGLLCTIRQDAPADDRAAPPVLEISGPFSLFRHTVLYGRALAELLPHLCWCARFELRAACRLLGRLVDVTLQTGDPIFPATPPALFDSQLEERFARDVARLRPDWDVVREPEPVRAGTTLIFPDFLLRHRLRQEQRVLVEIVGFWTPNYLKDKIAHLRQANLGRFVLCIDDNRACAADLDLPPDWPVVRFRRRVDAAAVMREVQRLCEDNG